MTGGSRLSNGLSTVSSDDAVVSTTCGTTAAVVVVVSGEGVAAAPLLSSLHADPYQQTRQHEARSPMSNVHVVSPS